jgi:hypothetical protein
MDYRGPDLDLRTSRWSAASTDPAGWREAGASPPPSSPAAAPGAAQRQLGQRSNPIWVDEVLLACANQAFDVALAYRSAAVELAHLLLAMTRFDAAAAALDARGVRVASLRRDAAVAIAGQLPTTEGTQPRRSPEVEDVLRLAAARAAHAGRAASVDDVAQVLGEVGADLSSADLVTRHFPRLARDFWGSIATARSTSHAGSHFVDASEGSSQLTLAGSTPSARAPAAPAAPAIDQTVVQRIFERLAEIERGFADRLAALEAAMARQSHTSYTDLSPIDSRLSAIESALHARLNGDGGYVIDTSLSDRLAAIEQALATERSERASAVTALSDEITGVRSAVRLAAQSSEQGQNSLAGELRQVGVGLEQHRLDLAASLGDRITAIERALDAHVEKVADASATYRAELSEVHEALMKITGAQQTLAGAIDSWRNNDSGEIHLINARIGAVHEDGAKRLKAIERLCADVETLSQLVLDDRSRGGRRGFAHWLFGTEDWIKASWRRPPSVPRTSGVKWQPRVSWRWPFKRKDGTGTAA